MLPADSVASLHNHKLFEEHAIDTIHTLLLNDSTLPMTFICETRDYKHLLILFYEDKQLGIEEQINMVRNIMLLNDVERYIFATETLSPNNKGLVFLHGNHHGLQDIAQYSIRRRNGHIKLSDKTESYSLNTNTEWGTLLTGAEVSSKQRKELESIVSTLPRNYPVKAFEYSEKINTYQPHRLN